MAPNPFDYLTELQRHAEELAKKSAAWMPWNYGETLAQSGAGVDSGGAEPFLRYNTSVWPKTIDSVEKVDASMGVVGSCDSARGRAVRFSCAFLPPSAS